MGTRSSLFNVERAVTRVEMTYNARYSDYAVGAFPTGELAECIQALRQRHDAKTARITAPHVTMAGTYWRNGPATPDNEAEAITRLQAIEDQLKPFELVLGGVESFLPHQAVIYLRIELTAGLLATRRRRARSAISV